MTDFQIVRLSVMKTVFHLLSRKFRDISDGSNTEHAECDNEGDVNNDR
jgi:hypothetical protein